MNLIKLIFAASYNKTLHENGFTLNTNLRIVEICTSWKLTGNNNSNRDENEEWHQLWWWWRRRRYECLGGSNEFIKPFINKSLTIITRNGLPHGNHV